MQVEYLRNWIQYRYYGTVSSYIYLRIVFVYLLTPSPKYIGNNAFWIKLPALPIEGFLNRIVLC